MLCEFEHHRTWNYPKMAPTVGLGILLSVGWLGMLILIRVPSAESSEKTACNLFIGIDETFWIKLEGNMSKIQARTEFIVRGLNRVFAQSVFGSFPAYRQLHFKIAQIEPIQPLCIDCDPDSVDYAHQLMDDFAKMDFTEYCLAYLFTDKNLKTTMSLANHDTVCEAFRPTCPRGQKSCRILGAIHEWPHWRSPNVGVVSFARVGHHINDEFTLLSVAHALGYSFGAKSDEYEGNEQCQNQGFIMSRLPALDRYSVCSYRAMTASLNKILFPTANPGTKRRNCFQESDAELKPSFCGNGILEAGEACDCGYNNDACEGTNLTMCCNPPGTNRNEKTENPLTSPCQLKPQCMSLVANSTSAATNPRDNLAINQPGSTATLDTIPGQQDSGSSSFPAEQQSVWRQILGRLESLEVNQIGLEKKFAGLKEAVVNLTRERDE